MSTATKNLPKNLIFNALSFLVKLLLGLWLVPFFIKNLGISVYGLIPIALIFTEYSSLIAQSFNVSTSRFLSIELNKSNQEKAVGIFNSSIVVIFLIVVAQFFFFFYLICNIELLVNIPVGYENDTRFLFILTYVGFTLTLFASVFNVSLYSKNRLDIIQKNEIIKQIVILIFIVGLFLLVKKNLVNVGFANLAGGFTILILSILQWKKITPELVLNLKKIDFKVIKPLFLMSLWIIVNTLGALLYIRIDAYVVNKFISAEASGQYSAVLQFSQVFRTAIALISNAVAPLSIIYFANNEIEKLINLYRVTVKFLTIIIAPTLAVMCVFSSNILTLWLGTNYANLWPLMVLQLFPLLINLGIYPLLTLNICTNKVKVPAIVTCILGGCNFVLAVMFVKFTSLGFYGVAIAGAIMLTIKNVVFTPIYAAKILSIDWHIFYRPLLAGSLNFVISCSVLSIVSTFVVFQGFYSLALFSILYIIVNILLFVKIASGRDEKAALIDIFPARLKFLARCL
jgi:membrane protein EpsK